MEADGAWKPGALPRHPHVVTELRRVHREARVVDDDAAGARAEPLQVLRQPVEDPAVGGYRSGARSCLRRNERTDTRTTRLLPLPVDGDSPTKEVDSIDGEAGRLRLAQSEPRTDRDRDGEPVVGLVEQRCYLVDGER